MSLPHINLSMLRVLDALGQAGSFTAAADRAGMTQSGVSHALRALEQAVGAPLVHRERAGASLTEVGQRALVEARTALDALDRLRGLSGAPASGRTRLALVPSAASRLAPDAVRRMKRDHPAVEIELLEGTDQEVLAWIEQGLADLGVGGEAGSCPAEPLVKDELRLVAPAAHHLARKPTASLADLDGASFVMSDSGCEPMLRRLFHEADVKPDIRLHVRETASLLAMVSAGIGVSILPELALPLAPPSSLVSRPFKRTLSRQLYLLKGTKQSSRATSAMEAALKI